ncbi:MAG: hypothetical protein FWD46_05840 [Cystobacterineae bacterium]|nr:hypothetical protein [Cystobacterineae bacterium]
MRTRKVVLGALVTGMVLGLVACGDDNNVQKVCEDGVERACKRIGECTIDKNFSEKECVQQNVASTCNVREIEDAIERCDKQKKYIDTSYHEKCIKLYDEVPCGKINSESRDNGYSELSTCGGPDLSCS